jgi:membrane-associated phospholipid phosphatase
VEDALRRACQAGCRLTGTLVTRFWVAWGSAGAFIALAIAVHLGLLDTFDMITRAWARPNDVWGAAQIRADFVVEGLRPTVVAGLLAAFTAACCVKRRSLRPAAFVGGVCLATVALTVAVKIIMGRPDPHGLLGSDGGSFPSGHVIVVMVGVGLAGLIARPRAGRWVLIIAALSDGLMGVCLLLQAAHWLTDLVGGSLLAGVVLSVATASRWSHRLQHRPRNDNQSATSTVGRSSSLTSAGAVRNDSKALQRNGPLQQPLTVTILAGEICF